MQDKDQELIGSWRSQLRKGSLELAVLLLLRRNRSYGLELTETLAKQFQMDVTAGSIYPLLSRLRKEKKVTTEWVDDGVGHARKYYGLTIKGERVCAAMLEAWIEQSQAFGAFIQGNNNHAK